MEKANVIIFGTGTNADDFIKFFVKNPFYNINLLCFFDNDKKKNEMDFYGKKVFLPFYYKKVGGGVCIIANSYYEECRNQLLEFGWPKEKIGNKYYFDKMRILNESLGTAELREYLTSHELEMYNAPFVTKYKKLEYPVVFDDEKKLFYVLCNNRKVFMKKSLDTERKVRACFDLFFMEQDRSCPHCYENFMPENDIDVLIDLGAAEACFTLRHVEKAKKIIIVEGDSEWCEALKYTFEEYEEKVLILPYFVSDIDSHFEKYITLDTILKKYLLKYRGKFSSCVVKMDIEGYEEKCLSCSDSFISFFTDLTFICTCYHHKSAKNNISHLLSKKGFSIEYSKGLMYFSKANENNTLDIGDRDANEVPLRTSLVCGRKLLDK